MSANPRALTPIATSILTPSDLGVNIAAEASLSGLVPKQGISGTAAVNQHGDVLPVGGINEKIEGYSRICTKAGLNGTQKVLIRARRRARSWPENIACLAPCLSAG